MTDRAAARRATGRAQSLAVAALIVAGGFLGSRLLGLLRSVIIANSFGTSPELDAYFVAFRLPDLVFQVLAGATLASAFIPTFARVHAREGEEQAWRLASSVLNLVLIATLAIAVIAFLLAPLIVPLMAPGLGQDTANVEAVRSLAVELTRIMLVSPVLFAVSGMFMGILNARRHFLTPALAPMLYNLSIIVAALLSRDTHVLAAAVVAGAVLHLAIQLPDLRFAGMTYSFLARWRDAAVREVGALMAPRMLGLAAAQINFFIANFFASQVKGGAISAVNFAFLIVMTPLGIIGMAISTAVFPTLAEQAATSEHDQLGATISRSLRLILFLSLPAGVGLVLLAKPLVVVMLQRGAFSEASADLTARALVFYALALFAHSGIEILSRGFYALSDTRTPVAFAIMSMLLNLALAAALVGPLEVRGLALALSVAATLEFAALYAVLAKRVPRLADGSTLEAIARMTVATAVMGLVVAAILLLLDSAGLSTDQTGDALLILAAGAGAGGLSYAVAATVLGCEEVRVVGSRLPWLRNLMPAPPGPGG